MFATLKVRILLGVYIFLILSIPIGAYLASQNQTIKGEASEEKKTPKPATSASPKSGAKKLQEAAQKMIITQSPKPSLTPEPTATVATSFGPTLALKILLEGRPADNQATSLFVGIVEGAITIKPKFLLSFTIDLPTSGEYDNLSLAGLSPGSSYTALLKGTAQIATSSAFLMSPSVTNLNGAQPILLLTGDLNDDNAVNSADYSIAKNAYSSTPTSVNWKEGADFNKDGIVNSLDLAFIVKNFGKIGDSGSWISPIPKVGTPSGGLTPEAESATLPVGSQGSTNSGYWIWISR